MEFVVANDLMGIIHISDCFFNINDIIYDIDNNLPEDIIFTWYWEQVEKSSEEEWINLDTYFKLNKQQKI